MPLDLSPDSAIKSSAAIFWLVLHGLSCLISLVLGFRFSRLVFLLFSASSTNFYTSPFHSSSELARTLDFHFVLPTNPVGNIPFLLLNKMTINSRVVVGRHRIRIRTWPHPNPVRTFQALHLTGVMHALMLVPYDLVWVVVEAGGISKETAALIAKSGLKTINVGFKQRMLNPVGILANSANSDEMANQKKEENPPMLVQGPACNASNMLAGWHTFNTSPFTGKSSAYIHDRATVLPKMLEWSGFVLNSRLLWKDGDKPDWIKDIDTLDGEIENPLSLVKDPSVVEPVGSCGRQVLLWWHRVEARANSKFPPR
ncbi:putative beta-1,4-xylosyltransferase IRX14 [Hibiscus syriacus]|uniref:Glycosyltransferases n=1 Tax=Hibiscus syriacus TaxID=106335 RepID=A0A6A2X2B8_HIBSY|nr:putative beta-1,4-xylosyltransferase IRX14 [Hibiscus syriacus]